MSARLAYVCDECNEPIEPRCPNCEERRHNEACEAHQRDRHEAEQARAWMREVPGVAGLEDLLGTVIELETSPDEDGELTYLAEMRLNGETVDGRSTVSHASAVRNLYLLLSDRLADVIEGREP